MSKLDEFIKSYSSKATRSSYKAHLNNYFKTLKVKDIDNYFTTNRDYNADVKTFCKAIDNKPPLSKISMKSCIKTFLAENDITIPKKTWDAMKRKGKKGSKPWTQDIIPTSQEIKQILTHGDSRARAFFLTLLSSGMRIGELCQIKLDDLNLNSNPISINIRGEYTKNDERRTVFITDETTEAIREWLKVRQDYIDRIYKHSKQRFKQYSINPDDNRVFPFKTQTARIMWIEMIQKAGFYKKDNSTGRIKMHPHCLRKFFISRMKTVSDIPEAVIEKLVGHEGYLSTYTRFDDRQMAEFYEKGIEKLLIFETQPDLSDVHEELIGLQNKNKTLNGRLNDLRLQVIELQLKLGKEKEKH